MSKKDELVKKVLKNPDKMTDEEIAEEIAGIDEGFDEHPSEYPDMMHNEDGVIDTDEENKHWDKDK